MKLTTATLDNDVGSLVSALHWHLHLLDSCLERYVILIVNTCGKVAVIENWAFIDGVSAISKFWRPPGHLRLANLLLDNRVEPWYHDIMIRSTDIIGGPSGHKWQTQKDGESERSWPSQCLNLVASMDLGGIEKETSLVPRSQPTDLALSSIGLI